jgi:hypothetical protein
MLLGYVCEGFSNLSSKAIFKGGGVGKGVIFLVWDSVF